MSEKQIDAIIEEIKKHDLSKRIDINKMKIKRLKDIQDENHIIEFYQKKNFTNETKRNPIQVDLESLALPLNEEAQQYHFLFNTTKYYTMREVAQTLIGYINEQISNNDNIGSIEEPRICQIEIQSAIRLPTDGNIWDLENQRRNEQWPVRILQALKDKGYIAHFECHYKKYIVYA